MIGTIKHFKDLYNIVKDEGIVEALRYDFRKTMGEETRAPVFKAFLNELGEKTTPEGLYERYLSHVKDGMTQFVGDAKDVALYYNLSLDPLVEAFEIGKRVEYDRLVTTIKEGGKKGAVGGVMLFGPRKAREMAKNYGLSLELLDGALRAIDYKKQAATHASLGRLGFTGNSTEAKRLSEEHGFTLP